MNQALAVQIEPALASDSQTNHLGFKCRASYLREQLLNWANIIRPYIFWSPTGDLVLQSHSCRPALNLSLLGVQRDDNTMGVCTGKAKRPRANRIRHQF